MTTSSNGNVFRVTGPSCGEFTSPGEFPSQRPVTRSFDVFFDLRPNKGLNKQSSRGWFEPPSRSLWRHYNVTPSVDWHQWEPMLRYFCTLKVCHTFLKYGWYLSEYKFLIFFRLWSRPIMVNSNPFKSNKFGQSLSFHTANCFTVSSDNLSNLWHLPIYIWCQWRPTMLLLRHVASLKCYFEDI